MYTTAGVQNIASITELRTDASGIIASVRHEREAVLIQRNGEPIAVLLPPEKYEQLTRTDDAE